MRKSRTEGTSEVPGKGMIPVTSFGGLTSDSPEVCIGGRRWQLKHALIVLALVFTATSVSAQCKKCGYDFYGCVACIDTFYDASVLCSITDLSTSFHVCNLQGECSGYLGAESCTKPGGCEQQRVQLDDVRQRQIAYSSRNWKLVSMNITRQRPVRTFL